MLDATEEYGNVDKRQAAAASSRKEGSPVEAAAVTPDHVCNRMVYKLVKVILPIHDSLYPLLCFISVPCSIYISLIGCGHEEINQKDFAG